MLFLAVFCGFLAENEREHFVEHQREKQFIRSLSQDLESDIAQSDKTIKRLEKTKAAMDSIVLLLRAPGVADNSNQLYRLWSQNIGFADFISNDRTLQQLKNSGSLRLIRKKNVSDSIMQYDRVLKDYDGQDALLSRVLENQTIYGSLFDFIRLDTMIRGPVPLTSKGAAMLNEAYAERTLWSFGLAGLIRRLRIVNETAVRTLALIRKEYHLK